MVSCHILIDYIGNWEKIMDHSYNASVQKM